MPLAPFLVRNANDRGVRAQPDAEAGPLQSRGQCFSPTRDDRVIGPAFDEEVFPRGRSSRGRGRNQPSASQGDSMPAYDPETCSPRTQISPWSSEGEHTALLADFDLDARQRPTDRGQTPAAPARRRYRMPSGGPRDRARRSRNWSRSGHTRSRKPVSGNRRKRPFQHRGRHAGAAVADRPEQGAVGRHRSRQLLVIRASMVGTTIAWVTSSLRTVSSHSDGSKVWR